MSRTGSDWKPRCLQFYANARRVKQPVMHLTTIQQNKDIIDFNEDLNEDKCEFFAVSLNRW